MDSPEPLLSTKLVFPLRPEPWLERSRLRFPAHLPRLVTLIAPAGYGKTSLMADWAQTVTRAGWLTLDHGDNDPRRCLRHFAAAFARADAALGGDLERLRAGETTLVRVLAAWVNRLCDAEPLTLFVDDLQTVDNPEVQSALAWLVEHQPPPLTLVLGSRHELPFPVSRLRAQRRLREFHAGELRLTAEELPTFCELMLPGRLSVAHQALLLERTEGWIGGLQLALSALEGEPDAEAFLSGFAGDDCHVTDFLADEILEGCPYSLLDFMLQTAVIDRFNPDLCDGLTGYADSRLMIDELVRRNLFVQALDHRREWFRYHPLLLSYLRKQLQEERPRLAAELHRRACQWLHLQGQTQAAVDQSLKAQALESEDLPPVPVDETCDAPVAQPAPRFSRKESQVARYILQGWSSPEIAEALCLSLSTIKTHTQNIYAKLGVNRRLHAIQRLQQVRWPDGKCVEAG